MTTLRDQAKSKPELKLSDTSGIERRKHRRHDLERHRLMVQRWDTKRNAGQIMGELVDLSSGGVRIRTNATSIRPDSQIRVRIELPAYAGICPFVDTAGQQPEPKTEWVGWMAVARVLPRDDKHVEVAGRLVDMDEMDRGMLGLYLSTQPLAA